MVKTENYIKEQVEKSNLEKAFARKNELKLGLTLSQSFALNDILCDLANQEFTKGLNKGYEIANQFNK
mgnify:CR=1 FL=1|jgi:hypothetical protein